MAPEVWCRDCSFQNANSARKIPWATNKLALSRIHARRFHLINFNSNFRLQSHSPEADSHHSYHSVWFSNWWSSSLSSPRQYTLSSPTAQHHSRHLHHFLVTPIEHADASLIAPMQYTVNTYENGLSQTPRRVTACLSLGALRYHFPGTCRRDHLGYEHAFAPAFRD